MLERAKSMMHNGFVRPGSFSRRYVLRCLAALLVVSEQHEMCAAT